jgi:hypothetical protein
VSPLSNAELEAKRELFSEIQGYLAQAQVLRPVIYPAGPAVVQLVRSLETLRRIFLKENYHRLWDIY